MAKKKTDCGKVALNSLSKLGKVNNDVANEINKAANSFKFGGDPKEALDRIQLAQKNVIRNIYLDSKAQADAISHIMSVADFYDGDMTAALSGYVNGEYGLKTGRNGAYQKVEAARKDALGEFVHALKTLDPTAENVFRNKHNMLNLQKIAYDLDQGNDVSGYDSVQVKIVQKLKEIERKQVSEINRRGGNIGLRSGRLYRTAHRKATLIKVGKSEWITDVRNTRDISTIMERNGFTNEKELVRFLGDIYDRAIKEKDEISSITTADKASVISEVSELPFKSPEDEISYNEKYSGKTIQELILSDLERKGHLIGMLDTFGPNTQDNFLAISKAIGAKTVGAGRRASEVELIIKDALKKRFGGDFSLSAIRGMIANDIKTGSGNYKKFLTVLPEIRSKIEELPEVESFITPYDYFIKLSGEVDIPEDINIHGVYSGIRQWSVASMLEKVGISALGDKSFLFNTARRLGKGYMESAKITAKSFIDNTSDKELMAVRLGSAIDGYRREFSRELTGINAKLAKANEFMFKWTGQMWLNKINQSAFVNMISTEWGRFADTGIMTPELQKISDDYGFTDAEIDIIKNTAYKMDDGHTYVTPDVFDTVADKAINNLVDESGLKRNKQNRERVLRDLQLKFRTMLSDISDHATLRPDNKTKTVSSLGTKAGTFIGEHARLFTAFQSFSIGVHNMFISRGFKENGLTELMEMAVVGTMMGYLVHVIKRGLQGNPPDDLFDFDTWKLAAKQGGTLGIYGDILLSSSQNRYGQGLNLTGAIMGSALDIPGNAIGTIEHSFTPLRDMPGVSHAIDYFILDTMMGGADSFAEAFKDL
jgi:hypothetical protein